MKSHDLTEETWVENPEFILDIIRNNIQHQSDFDEEFAQAVIKRQETYEHFMSQVKDETFKTKFETLYQFALQAANIRDDHHFYIDAMLDAKARVYLLKIGELLVQKERFLIKKTYGTSTMRRYTQHSQRLHHLIRSSHKEKLT